MSKEPIVIDPEWLGLPLTASNEEVRTAVRAMSARLQEAEDKAAKWKARAEENQAALLEAKKAIGDKAKMEAELIVTQAVADLKIEADEKDFYMELYAKDAELCKKRLASLEDKRYLTRQDSLRGPIGEPPVDGLAELSRRVAEIRKENPSLTEDAATSRAYEETPGLWERVRKQELSASSGKGDND